jgi:SRSO17 transposase
VQSSWLTILPTVRHSTGKSSAQLFLPESWTQDAERRKQAQVPKEIEQQTKPEIALDLLDRARQWGVPIQAVVVDAGYGDNPNFLHGLDERQVPYMCAVQSTFGCRLPRRGLRRPPHRHPSTAGAVSRANPALLLCIPSKS